MNCKCGNELRRSNDLVYCPKCGYVLDVDRIKALYEFING